MKFLLLLITTNQLVAAPVLSINKINVGETPIVQVYSSSSPVNISGTNVYVKNIDTYMTAKVLQCGEGLDVCWSSSTNEWYCIDVSSDCKVWSSLNISFRGNGSKFHFYDLMDAPARFYRVRVVPTPTL